MMKLYFVNPRGVIFNATRNSSLKKLLPTEKDVLRRYALLKTQTKQGWFDAFVLPLPESVWDEFCKTYGFSDYDVDRVALCMRPFKWVGAHCWMNGERVSVSTENLYAGWGDFDSNNPVVCVIVKE